MIDCELMEELLPLYVDGEATTDERTLVEEHLGYCEDCRIMSHYIRRVNAAILALPAVPEYMRQRMPKIDGAVRRRTRRKRLPIPRMLLLNGASKVAGSLAAIVLLGAVAFLLSSALSQMQQAKSSGVSIARTQPGKIAFVKGGDIWVKELPDGEAKRLTQDGRNSQPLWSPSGEWLAFRKENSFWVIRASGADAHQIQADDVSGLSWSPVDDRLAYNTAAGLFTMNADGSGLRKVADDAGGVVWSPDGNWFAFVRTEGAPKQLPSAWELWRMKTDGTERKKIYSSPNPAEQQLLPVSWSPDGQFLLFWSGLLIANSASADGMPLMRVPVVGGTPVEITRMMLVNRDFLDWSPNGRQLAFVDGGPRMSWDNKRIAVVDGGGAARVLSDQGRADLFPAWSPDGSLIAYTSGPAAPGIGGGDSAKQAMAQRHIWVMAPDGTGKRELINDPAYRDERPSWSGDGAFILFARLKDDKMELWMMRADGSEQRLVADDLSVADTGSISPPIWFAFYGNIGWGQVYDWWR